MKNKMMICLLTYFLIGTLIISIIACGKSQNELIGKWQCDESTSYDGKKVTLEIFDNKTFRSNKIMFNSGNWYILKDGRIQINSSLGQIVIANVKGNKLQIEFAGYIEIYHKIKE